MGMPLEQSIDLYNTDTDVFKGPRNSGVSSRI